MLRTMFGDLGNNDPESTASICDGCAKCFNCDIYDTIEGVPCTFVNPSGNMTIRMHKPSCYSLTGFTNINELNTPKLGI